VCVCECMCECVYVCVCVRSARLGAEILVLRRRRSLDSDQHRLHARNRVVALRV